METVTLNNQKYVVVEKTDWCVVEDIKKQFLLLKKVKGSKTFFAVKFESNKVVLCN